MWLVGVDYAESISNNAFSSGINATLARSVLAVEAHTKNTVKATMLTARLPAPSLVGGEV